MYYPMYFGFDPTYMLVLLGVVICMLASARMNSTFNRYSRVRNHSGMTGREAAERILYSSGIRDVRVEHVSGNLTDHYDPKNKVLRLSDATYNSSSVAALGVAAHECGHAMQHASGYVVNRLINLVNPVVQISSNAAIPIFILGLIFSLEPLQTLGILLFSAVVIFQLLTLPCEINASRRAIVMLKNTGIVRTEEEIRGAKKVLFAAGLTYVAALAGALLQLLRLIILSGGRRRDD